MFAHGVEGRREGGKGEGYAYMLNEMGITANSTRTIATIFSFALFNATGTCRHRPGLAFLAHNPNCDSPQCHRS